jgi:hypothetical protein
VAAVEHYEDETMNTNNSTEPDEDTMMMCCASCGVAEVDGIKLKKCTACKSVRYCSVECQKKHRLKHKRACKKKKADLRDEILFRQPESIHFGDCPICLLPLPIDPEKSIVMGCCSKVICNGCHYTNQMREMEGRLNPSCPFCRHPIPETLAGHEILLMKRVKVDDPESLCFMGNQRFAEGDYEGAFKCWTTAAQLGDAIAHYQLSVMYREGHGVENDKKKELHHLTEAATSGHPNARYNLACCEETMDRIERAVKHWIIAANLGHDDSIKSLKLCYGNGEVSKEDFAAALRAHQAAVDATKSPQREAAEAVEAARKK